MQHFKYQYIFLVLFISITSVTNAQRILTLEEALATTLQNNYDIQLSKNDSLITAIDYSYRNAVFLPAINANASRVWNTNNQKVKLADGTERAANNVNSNNLQAGLGLNWKIFDGMKMFISRDKLDVVLETGSEKIKAQITDKLAEVTKIYYNIARQKQLIKATDVQINLNDERAKLAQYKLEIGTGAKPDVLQSKVDLNERKAQKLQQETLEQQLKQQLLQAMNSQIKNNEFEISDVIPINLDINFSDINDSWERNNPNLQLSKKQIKIAELSIKEAEADRWPTVSLTSNYNYSRNANQKVVNQFSPLFSRNNGLNYGFSIGVPILNYFNINRQIKQNKLNVSLQNLSYENQKSKLFLSILNTYQSYLLQKKALDLEAENIKLAEENVSIIFQSYKLAHATLVQLREAQLSLAQANDRLIDARYNLKLAEIELQRLNGQ